MPLNPDTTLEAHISAVLFLGSAVLVIVLGGVFVALRLRGESKRAANVAKLLGCGALAYLVALGFFSLISREKILARGAEKHFCELDCHLAYSVADLRRADNLGETAAEPGSTFWVLALRTRFDEATISPMRGNGLLYPNPREIAVIDGRGRRYLPLPLTADGEALLQLKSTPITTPLRPAESYVTVLAFELPKDVQEPRLLLTEGEFPQTILIGHENSLGHKKTYFRLDANERAEKLF